MMSVPFAFTALLLFAVGPFAGQALGVNVMTMSSLENMVDSERSSMEAGNGKLRVLSKETSCIRRGSLFTNHLTHLPELL